LSDGLQILKEDVDAANAAYCNDMAINCPLTSDSEAALNEVTEYKSLDV